MKKLFLTLLILFPYLTFASCPEVQLTSDGKAAELLYPGSFYVYLGYDEASDSLVTEVFKGHINNQYSAGSYKISRGEEFFHNTYRRFWDPVTGLVTVPGPIAPIPFFFTDFFLRRAYTNTGRDLTLLLDLESQELVGGEPERSALILELIRDAGGQVTIDAYCASDDPQNASATNSQFEAAFTQIRNLFGGVLRTYSGDIDHVLCFNDFSLLYLYYPMCQGGAPLPGPYVDTELTLVAEEPGPTPTPTPTPTPGPGGGSSGETETTIPLSIEPSYQKAKKELSLTFLGIPQGATCDVSLLFSDGKRVTQIGVLKSIRNASVALFPKIPLRTKNKVNSKLFVYGASQCEVSGVSASGASLQRAVNIKKSANGKTSRAIIKKIKKAYDTGAMILG